jgi:hypothetical protein
LLERIRTLLDEDLHAAAMARILAAEGWTSAHGKSFTEGSVGALLTRMAHISTSAKRPSAIFEGQAGESTVAEIAAHLNIPEGNIYGWICKHRLSVRRAKAAWHTLHLLHLSDVEQHASGPKADACLPDRLHDPSRYQATTPDLNVLWRGIMTRRRTYSFTRLPCRIAR